MICAAIVGVIACYILEPKNKLEVLQLISPLLLALQTPDDDTYRELVSNWFRS